MVFDLPVMEERVKSHHITTLHLVCALAFIVTGAIIAVYNYTIPGWGVALLAAGVFLVTTVIIKNKWIISKEINPVIRIAELLISITVAIYSFAQHWKFPAGIFSVLGAAVVFALSWERPGKPLIVHIDKEGALLPASSRKKFKPWTEIDLAILRYGILTIECTDNTLYQWSIADSDTEEHIFDAYCKAQVEEHRSKRRKDDW